MGAMGRIMDTDAVYRIIGFERITGGHHISSVASYRHVPICYRRLIADRWHWLITGLTGGLMGIGAVLYGLGLVVVLLTKTTVPFYLTPVWATLFA